MGCNGWSRAVRKVSGIALPLALTAGLLWYMFAKVPFGVMMDILRGPVCYWWILLAMVLSIFSHVIRAMRWRIQLRSLGIEIPLMDLSCSVFGCYALNLLFPRLGEVWRCTYVSRRSRSSFSTVLGSLVADRGADALAVGAMFLLALCVASGAIASFMDRYEVGRRIVSAVSQPEWIVAIIAGCGIVCGILMLLRNTRPVKRVLDICLHVWQGFSSVLTMRGRGRFLLLTVMLWGCYFVQLYVAFFAFDFTARLCGEPSLAFGLTPCLVAFVLSSFGMAIPSNGGLGPWNLAIMFGLGLYGVTDDQGVAFSMLQWSGQTVMLVLLGIFTMTRLASRKNHRELSK